MEQRTGLCRTDDPTECVTLATCYLSTAADAARSAARELTLAGYGAIATDAIVAAVAATDACKRANATADSPVTKHTCLLYTSPSPRDS